MRFFKHILCFLLLASSSFGWLGGSGGGGGGGGIGGTGAAGRVAVFTSPTAIGSSLITAPGTGVTGFLDSGATLRLNIFSANVTDGVIQPVTGDLILRDMGGVDRLIIQSGLAPEVPSGLMFPPISAPAADATRDVIFKDTADGEIKVRKSTADGGLVVSLEGGGGGGGSTFVEDSFTPGVGQTNFTLSQTFVGAGGHVEVIINDASYPATRYTIVGTSFTWGDSPFTLDGGDLLTVKYQTN